MKISVEGRTTTIEVEYSDVITDDVKAKNNQDKDGSSSNQQRLIKDEKKDLTLRLRSGSQVLVKTQAGRTVALEVEQSDSDAADEDKRFGLETASEIRWWIATIACIILVGIKLP